MNLVIVDKPGKLPISVMRQNFEVMIHDTPGFAARFNLEINEWDGKFYCYKSDETDNLWFGFAAGMWAGAG